MWNDIVVHDVPQATRRSFRAICLTRGYTLRDAVIWFAESVVKGKIVLPEKK